MAEVGPDGQVWVIDWYNYIVQHNPTPQGFTTGKGNAYESDLRDKTHGRIYRVVYDQAPATATSRPQLSMADPKGLVDALAHSNRLWRRHAQRLLVERGQRDIEPQLIGLVKNSKVDEAGLNAGAIHALWTLKGLGALQAVDEPAFAAAVSALKHASAGVRRNAALVLPNKPESIAALAAAGTLGDSEPQVRLAALMTLADMPENALAGQLLAKAASEGSNMRDRWLKEGLICAGATQALPLLGALLTTTAVSGATQQTPATINAEVQSGKLELTTVLAEHVARSRPSSAQLVALLKSMASGDPALAEAIVAGLAAGWPRDYQPEITADMEKELDALVANLPLAARGQLVMLAGAWGSQKLQRYAAEIIAGLNEKIANNQLAVADRLQAVRQLLQVSNGSDEVIDQLLNLLTPQRPPELTSGIVRALSASRSTRVGDSLIARWPTLTPALRADAVSVLLLRPDSARQLTLALIFSR
jgi:hypothetical protein